MAVDAFTKQFTWDIQNYTVGIKETHDTFEVWLVPDLDTDNLLAGDIVYGRNKFGKEVHYVISKDEYKIVRIEFAR